MSDLPARIQAKIEPEPTSGCWLWTGCLMRDGYGGVRWGGVMRPSHRVVYEILSGPILAGLTLDHLCRVPSCCNPDHLRPKTMRDNLHAVGSQSLPALNAAKTRCPQGHEYTTSWGGHRHCLTCRRAQARAYGVRRRQRAVR